MARYGAARFLLALSAARRCGRTTFFRLEASMSASTILNAEKDSSKYPINKSATKKKDGPPSAARSAETENTAPSRGHRGGSGPDRPGDRPAGRQGAAALQDYAGFDQERHRPHRREGRRRGARPARPARAGCRRRDRARCVRGQGGQEHLRLRARHALDEELRTVGVISHDEITGITEIAEPVGVVARRHPGDQPHLDDYLQEPAGAEDPEPDRVRLPPGRPAVLGAGRPGRPRRRGGRRRTGALHPVDRAPLRRGHRAS